MTVTVSGGMSDYRQVWMDATEQVRSMESAELSAVALVTLVQKALGSLDLGVWLRVRDSSTMQLIAARGMSSDRLPVELADMVEQIAAMTRPTPVADLPEHVAAAWPAEFLTRTRAAVLVPLTVSGRVIGLMTVGNNGSGTPLKEEAHEFLRLIAVHFANELHKSELLSMLVEAREAEAFDGFSTFLLHDLKNFASTLSLIAENGVRHHGNPDFQADAFQSMVAISEKMKRLCTNWRTPSTRLAANKTPDDVNQIVLYVAEMFEASLGRLLQLELGEVPPVVVDRDEIVRVLQNLILNAHEASPEGGAVRIATCCEAGKVVISVTDCGRGIPREFLEKALFQPFQTTKPDGSGIGLFQSKKIVEAHDGAIEMESREENGTVVRVILPSLETHAGEKARHAITGWGVIRDEADLSIVGVR